MIRQNAYEYRAVVRFNVRELARLILKATAALLVVACLAALLLAAEASLGWPLSDIADPPFKPPQGIETIPAVE
jgi:hypothetical protein